MLWEGPGPKKRKKTLGLLRCRSLLSNTDIYLQKYVFHLKKVFNLRSVFEGGGTTNICFASDGTSRNRPEELAQDRVL